MGRKKLAIDKHAAILEAARELFGKYGYERTTIDDIAHQTGLSKGSVYLEFTSKEDILMGVIWNHYQEEVRVMAQTVESARGPFLDELKGMLVSHILSVYDCAMKQEHSAERLAYTSTRVRAELSPMFKGLILNITHMLEQAARAKEMCSARANENTATLIMTALSGLFPPYQPNWVDFTDKQAGQSKLSRQELSTHSSNMLDLLIVGLRGS